MSRSFIVIICVLAFQLIQGQSSEVHSRVRINLAQKNIKDLIALGIETDHGKIAKGRFIESDYSQSEIESIKAAGFEVTTIIADVTSHYSDPDRPSELIQKGYRFGNCLIDPNQHKEYKTPVNYSYGSMGGYLTYDEMLEQLDIMAFYYPTLITLKEPIGDLTTNDGNQIWVIKISDNPDTDEPTEDQLLYTGLHHAREPVSISQMMFYMWYLLENYSTDEEIRHYVNSTEMYFVPCVNPDGYKLNQKNKPNGGGFWRKNTTKNETGTVVGVDLNRNYGYKWGFDNEGSSTSPNSETYRGTEGFSEIETKAIQLLCKEHDFALALNYHTYGNLLIHPWGYNDQPTNEDIKFKAMAREMNADNAFTIGTGTETVGYVTNGDSDDYMYGDTTDKLKIYSYTPEVGQSFWPPQGDIDVLNKSCLYMNLALPKLMSNFSKITYSLPSNAVFSSADTIEFQIQKIGIREDAVRYSISADENFVEFVTIEDTLLLKTGESKNVSFRYKLKEGTLISGQSFNIYATIFYDDARHSDTLALTYILGEKTTEFLDDVEGNLDFWSTNASSWAKTNLVSYSPSLSMTDSPGTAYTSNTINTIDLIETFDLSDASYAEVNFTAKWEIEDNFDYAQFSASTDGGQTYTALCGLYTDAGSGDQIPGEPVYDGSSDGWKKETIILDDLIGKPNVSFRFSMISDGFLEMDGFYFDDFALNVIKKLPSGVTDNLHSHYIMSPNPAADEISVVDLNGGDILQLELYSMSGKLLQTTRQGNSMDLKNILTGIYLVKIVSSTDVLPVYKKLSVVK